ncbi:MAG: hypothetical protein ABW049_12625, partial [Spongiibacteraceae bacterium]
MNNNDRPESPYDEAGRLVRLCEALDFEGIVQHRPKAVSALQNVVRTLNLTLPRRVGDKPVVGGGIVDVRVAPTLLEAAGDDAAELQLRRRQLVESLTRAGLGDRMGKIYSSLTDDHLRPFRDAPHKMGLPAFDMVLAPDFSPETGLHGIFIGVQEVVSCLLPGADSSRTWQVRERARFGNPEELVDIVSLMSAGFP